MSERLIVVIPCFNEAEGITATLDALRAQTVAPSRVIVVDNASTDGTRGVVESYAARFSEFPLVCVTEAAKGTGRAARRGFAAAIEDGATVIARTDADCLPAPRWLENILDARTRGAEFIIGKITLRTDDYRPSLTERAVLPSVVGLAAVFGRFRPSNRGPQFKCAYRMCAGNNMAITADLYSRVGGWAESSIEVLHEDRDLLNRCRETTGQIVYRRDVRVANSLRRVRAYGLKNTLLWYWDHRYTPATVDIR